MISIMKKGSDSTCHCHTCICKFFHYPVRHNTAALHYLFKEAYVHGINQVNYCKSNLEEAMKSLILPWNCNHVTPHKLFWPNLTSWVTNWGDSIWVAKATMAKMAFKLSQKGWNHENNYVRVKLFVLSFQFAWY